MKRNLPLPRRAEEVADSDPCASCRSWFAGFWGQFRKKLAALATIRYPEGRSAVVRRNWSGSATIGGADAVPGFRWTWVDLRRVHPKGLATRRRDAIRRHLRSLDVLSELADPLAYCAGPLVWRGASLGRTTASVF